MRPAPTIPLVIATSLLGLAGAAAAAPAVDPPADAAARLAHHLVRSRAIAEDLETLCDRIGGRLTGTPACRRAVAWAKERFEDAGVDAVRTEPFEMGRLWLPGDVRVEALGPEAFPVSATGVPFSPATGPIEAPLFDAGTGTPEDFARAGPGARSAIGLVRTAPMESLVDLFTEYMRNRAMIEAAGRSGAAGLILMSTRPRGLLYRHPVLLDGSIAPLPLVLAAREPALRLGRILASGDAVRVRMEAQAEIGPAFTSHNVVAEIRGRAAPDEIVLIGAHLDSWDLGTGAQDNGVNCAAILDIARAMKSLSLVPRRTVRFALFTGEEQGLWGSAAYVRRHAASLDDHIAVVILDIGSGAIEGFYLNGREELEEPVDRALVAVADLGPFTHPVAAVDGTDNFDFLLSGVPNLVASQRAAPYLPDYHASSDVVDAVDFDQAARNAAIAAALVWSLAEAPDRPAARQTRAEVEALIAATGLEPQMRAFGQWEGWMSGARGVSR